MGLDVGGLKVGVAVCGHPWEVVVPAGKMYRRGKKDEGSLHRVLCGKVKRFEVGLVVVGWPLELSGRAGRRCAEVQSCLLRLLALGFKVPMVNFDERYTTRMAQSLLAEVGYARAKEVEDEVAAAAILDGFLSLPVVRSVVGERRVYVPRTKAEAAACRLSLDAHRPPRKQKRAEVLRAIFNEEKEEEGD